MKIHHCKQREKEWFKLRLGIPTSSSFDRILQPKKLELSASADGYACELASEWCINENTEGADSGFMGRGQELEPQARLWYTHVTDDEVVKVGFISNDAGTVGCSPDGLIGEDGGLEIKCPAAKKHAEYVCDPKKLVADYRLQIQASLWISERAWWDAMSFNPSMKECLIRVEPDEKVFAAFEEFVPLFLKLVEEKKRKLLDF